MPPSETPQTKQPHASPRSGDASANGHNHPRGHGRDSHHSNHHHASNSQDLPDNAIITALNDPRQRNIILRGEQSLENFVLDKSIDRIPVSEIEFTRPLNPYRRLLLHRLADWFRIDRVLPTTEFEQTYEGPPFTLAKNSKTRIPPIKLALLVPTPPGYQPSQNFYPGSEPPFRILQAQSMANGFPVPEGDAKTTAGAPAPSYEDRAAAYGEARQRIFRDNAGGGPRNSRRGRNNNADYGDPNYAPYMYAQQPFYPYAGGPPPGNMQGPAYYMDYSQFGMMYPTNIPGQSLPPMYYPQMTYPPMGMPMYPLAPPVSTSESSQTRQNSVNSQNSKEASETEEEDDKTDVKGG